MPVWNCGDFFHSKAVLRKCNMWPMFTVGHNTISEGQGHHSRENVSSHGKSETFDKQRFSQLRPCYKVFARFGHVAFPASNVERSCFDDFVTKPTAIWSNTWGTIAIRVVWSEFIENSIYRLLCNEIGSRWWFMKEPPSCASAGDAAVGAGHLISLAWLLVDMVRRMNCT
jgi:hypothetical protein